LFELVFRLAVVAALGNGLGLCLVFGLEASGGDRLWWEGLGDSAGLLLSLGLVDGLVASSGGWLVLGNKAGLGLGLVLGLVASSGGWLVLGLPDGLVASSGGWLPLDLVLGLGLILGDLLVVGDVLGNLVVVWNSRCCDRESKVGNGQNGSECQLHVCGGIRTLDIRESRRL